MARKTAVELALEHIDARIAPLNAELHGLQLARQALLNAGDPADAPAPKAKRGRGKAKKAGLPAAPDPDDEAARMSV